MSSRGIVKKDTANFTPALGEYKDLQPFRFWRQKVLPLVYDDSLSYYELLCKVVDYLNKTMEDVDTLEGDVTGLHEAYVKLQNYVNNYFSTLDVQTEINNKLDTMAKNGYFYNIFKTYKNNRKGVIIGDSYTQLPTPAESSCEIALNRAGIHEYHNLGVSGVALDGYIEQVKNYPYSDAENITDVLITGCINNAHEVINDDNITNLIKTLMSEINKKFTNAQIWVGFSGNGYYVNLENTYAGFNYNNVKLLKYIWFREFNNFENVNYMDNLDTWCWTNNSCDIDLSGIHPYGIGIIQLSNNIANYLKWNTSCVSSLTETNIHFPSKLKNSLDSHGINAVLTLTDSEAKLYFNGGGENLTENITLSTGLITLREWDIKDKTKNTVFFNNSVKTSALVIYKADGISKMTFGDFTLYKNQLTLSSPELVNPVSNISQLWYGGLTFIMNRDVI